MLLPPQRSSLHCTCIEVKHRPYGTHMTVNIQFMPVRIRPLLLLGSRHTYPQQVGIGTVYCLYDSLVVLVSKLRFVGRRIRHHLQVRIIHCRTLLYQAQHLRRTAHKHHLERQFACCSIRSIGQLLCPQLQSVHLEGEKVPSRYTFRGLALRLYPLASLHNAHPIRNQHIPLLKGFCKETVLLCRIEGMGIHCVYEQLPIGQRSQFSPAAKNCQRLKSKHNYTYIRQLREPHQPPEPYDNTKCRIPHESLTMLMQPKQNIR